MPLKIQAASPEEHAFAAQVNKRLAGTGARVNAYETVDKDSDAREYFAQAASPASLAS